MKLINYCNRIIEYSFYALFFLVPLVFSGDTSELFELNKMWLTFGLTAVIGAAWASKMMIQKRFVVQRTPIDILLLLFLISQIISSIFSLDQHVSWWGYYSRFNGGLLSTICYFILYYAFVSNFSDLDKKKPEGVSYSFTASTIIVLALVAGIITSGFSSSTLLIFIFSVSFFIGGWFLKKSFVTNTLLISLYSGLAVAIWGFPSHFGADPTCLMFRGTFDTTCWTDAFKPTIRAFSTLGQPAWLAAYMAFLLPVSMAYVLKNKAKQATSIAFIVLTVLFYLLLIFSSTRAGFIAFWIANIIFWAAIYIKKLYQKQYIIKMLLIINILFIVCTFLFDSPLGSLSKYTLPEIMQSHATAAAQPAAPAPTPATPAGSALDSDGITDSGTIRLLVWNGAIKAWENNPIFGTGVETFAFAYYKYKSPAHNLTSEWDYLYNKAHNEYLNYLTTTGIFGLGTYLGFMAIFFFLTAKWFIATSMKNHQQAYSETARSAPTTLLVIGIIAGYISMLISNFFGFSVVIINLYIFLAPAFVFILLGLLDENKQLVFPVGASETDSESIGPYQWTFILIFIAAAAWINISLIWYRQADIAYALGNNLDKVGQYQQAYPQLLHAVQMVPNEPVFQDELSINLAALSAGFYSQKDTTHGGQAAQNAVALSNDVVTHHPNNVVYWKDRVRLFYTLSATDQTDESTLLQNAVEAINTAKGLAPTDAKISYNQGVLYGQAGDIQQAINILNETIKLKPDYTDAYVALGLFYHQAAVDQKGKVIHPDMQQKAIDTYNYILTHLEPNNAQVKKSLQDWRTQ